eukprot:3797982-Alexandrium_andersonii.AAC.1
MLAFFTTGWARAAREVQGCLGRSQTTLRSCRTKQLPKLLSFARGVEETLSMLKSAGCAASVEKLSLIHI